MRVEQLFDMLNIISTLGYNHSLNNDCDDLYDEIIDLTDEDEYIQNKFDEVIQWPDNFREIRYQESGYNIIIYERIK